MSTTSVYSIRIDSRVKRIIDELDDPLWQEEVRTLIEQSARRKRKAEILARVQETRHVTGEELPAADVIRADRDAR